MTIRRKILLGFFSIGVLLFFSGIISTLELVRFNEATYTILEKSRSSIELSKTMLDAVQEQNTALLMSITDTSSVYDSILKVSNSNFERALNTAKMEHADNEIIPLLEEARGYYLQIIDQAKANPNLEWFSQVYKTSYYNLTYIIKEFMLSVQNQIIDYTDVLKTNAYRASMVGIIALASGIILMVMFYYMLNHFFLRPVLAIRRSLKLYLDNNIPFDIHITTKDEILELKDDVSELIDRSKK